MKSFSERHRLTHDQTKTFGPPPPLALHTYALLKCDRVLKLASARRVFGGLSRGVRRELN